MAQTVCILVSLADRDRLLTVISDRNRPHKHVERARIVLASADYRPVQQIAQQLGVSRPMVWRWQQRFAEQGVDGLLRDKTRRPGKAPIAAETVAQVVSLTCGQPPGETTHWTGRAMAKVAAMISGSPAWSLAVSCRAASGSSYICGIVSSPSLYRL